MGRLRVPTIKISSGLLASNRGQKEGVVMVGNTVAVPHGP